MGGNSKTNKTSDTRKKDTSNTSEAESDHVNMTNIKTMFSNILTELKEMRKQNEEFRNETRRDITTLKEEIQSLDRNLETKCVTLENKIYNADKEAKEKIKHLEDSIQAIQVAEEHRQRRERRNNIIIKSKEINKDTGNALENKVKEILKNIEAEEAFTRATYIGTDNSGKGLVRVELTRLKDKISIMKNKHKLKGQECYIDDDMTNKEREIQAVLRKRAREEREKGNTVKVGYQKIMINNQWENWQPASQQQIT